MIKIITRYQLKIKHTYNKLIIKLCTLYTVLYQLFYAYKNVYKKMKKQCLGINVLYINKNIVIEHLRIIVFTYMYFFLINNVFKIF